MYFFHKYLKLDDAFILLFVVLSFLLLRSTLWNSFVTDNFFLLRFEITDYCLSLKAILITASSKV